MRDKTHLEALRTTELDVEIYISEYFQCLAGAFLLWTMNYELRTYTIDSIAVSVSETNPNDNLMMRRAGLSKWRHLVAKFETNANGTIWWPNLELMLMAPSGGQNWNQSLT